MQTNLKEEPKALQKALEQKQQAEARLAAERTKYHKCRTHRPDVIIHPLIMSGLDCLECLKRIRCTWPEIKTVITYGGKYDLLREAARAAGCDVLVNDPFNTDAICRAVQECLEKLSPTETIRSAVRELVFILTEPETSLNQKR